MLKTSSTPTLAIAQVLQPFDINIADIATKDITNDSRLVKKGDIFCATIGEVLDGREFIDNAIANGAALVIAQCTHIQQHGSTFNKAGCVVVQFYQLNNKLFELVERYYQSPQKQLNMIAITGTNGKTSTAFMVANLLTACQQKTALIGTLGAGFIDNLTPLNNTTPGAVEVMRYLAGFKEQAVNSVVMEVSSHALVQKRVVPELFNIAVFTNLSRDHLDYHQTMENYAAAKFALFHSTKPQQAIVNGDDEYARDWLTSLPISERDKVVVFATKADSKLLVNIDKLVFASRINCHAQGVSFELQYQKQTVLVNSPLLGSFNVANLLAAITVLLTMDIALETIADAVTLLTPALGRMESFYHQGKPLSVVDYAHTPDGLENALLAVKEHCQGKLWLVFGCGGDRDKGKRSEMGAIAEKLADHVIVTNDNPRNEAAEMIVSDILSGFEHPEKATVILNRQQAASSALAHAKAQDAILFAGKGHEEHIIIGNEKIPYNERALVKAHYQEAVL